MSLENIMDPGSLTGPYLVMIFPSLPQSHHSDAIYHEALSKAELGFAGSMPLSLQDSKIIKFFFVR